ncbi:MAG: glycosyltransferase family 9 protein [Acidobacteriota bacterium]
MLPAFRELVEAACDSAEASRALFGILAEGLSDRFEPRLVEAYAGLFAEAIAFALPQCKAADLLARYERVRRPRRFEGRAERVRNVFVLSRVTLGADIAVTSLVLDAVKRRFPEARVFLVGSEKNWQLFAADARVGCVPVTYGRSLRERLAAGLELQARLSQAGSVVIDPDSRLTQLGLLPVCPEEDYFFFESRGYGGDGEESLAELTRRWLDQTFGVADAWPWIAPAVEGEGAHVAISFGVGDNPAKRIPDPFEEELLRGLSRRGLEALVDKGAGGEEAARVERAVAGSGQVRMFEGSFAAFATRIMRSRLYVGYDSAGQHAAAAAGVPLVTVFAGFPSPRFFARWQPTGPGPKVVIRVDDPDPAAVLRQTLEAVMSLPPSGPG